MEATTLPLKAKRRPAFPQVVKTLKERIEQGIYDTERWFPAERALAEELDVDRSVVRAALTQLAEQDLIVRQPGRRPWISDRAKQGGILPSRLAAPLRMIAVIVPQHPVYPVALAVIHGVTAGLRRRKDDNYRLAAFDTHAATPEDSARLEKHALESVDGVGIAGAIVWPTSGGGSEEGLRRCQEAGCPVVLIDRDVPGRTCDFVAVDNRTSAREAVDYLIGLGHRRIAHLTDSAAIRPVRERREGYQEALHHAGIAFSPELIFTARTGLDPDIGPCVDRLLSLPDPPTAVFSMNDALAHFFISAVEARGRRVPNDLSVIGFDDVECFSPRPPLLTTMHQPFDLIGRRAAELLLQQFETPARSGRATYQHLLLPTRLVNRTTCSAPRGEERRR